MAATPAASPSIWKRGDHEVSLVRMYALRAVYLFFDANRPELVPNIVRKASLALQEGGFAMTDIVRATYYLTDIRDADAHFAVCGEILGDIRPAATMLVVSALAKPEMKVEIEVTAKRRAA